jgi:hypothetical protein
MMSKINSKASLSKKTPSEYSGRQFKETGSVGRQSQDSRFSAGRDAGFNLAKRAPSAENS